MELHSKMTETEIASFENIVAERLQKGMTIRNYLELCSLLELKPKSSFSRTAQLKQLHNFVTWSKVGHKFIITDIHPYKNLVEDKRCSNNSVYADHIKKLLVDHLKKNPTSNYKTLKEWYCTVGLVNENYTKYRCGFNPTTEKIPTDDEIYLFYSLTAKTLNDIFNRALHNLRDKEIISVGDCYVVEYSDGESKLLNDDETRIFYKVLKRKKYTPKTINTLFFIKKANEEFLEMLNIVLNKDSDKVITKWTKQKHITLLYPNTIKSLRTRDIKSQIKQLNRKTVDKMLHVLEKSGISKEAYESMVEKSIRKPLESL